MHDDDLGNRLRASTKAPTGKQPDVAWVLQRGRRLRRNRLLVATGTGLLISILVTTVVLSMPSSENPSPIGPQPGPTSTPEIDRQGNVVGGMSEQFRAEIFAHRAVARNGLMGPYLPRSYNWTEEEPSQTQDGWKVGFAVSDCVPKGGAFTCKGLSGEDPQTGNALANAFLTVEVSNDEWEVVQVEGNVRPEERERLLGYSLKDREEAPHWEFSAVGVWNSEYAEAMPLWVGPFPTDAPGSACRTTYFDENGTQVGVSRFYQAPPQRYHERGGWIHGGLGDPPEEDFVSADVRCEQHRAGEWEPEGSPSIVGEPGDVHGVAQKLQWHGEERITAAASCRANLVDEEGQVVWEGKTLVRALSGPEMDDYPYETVAAMTTGGPVDAQAVGAFECETL